MSLRHCAHCHAHLDNRLFFCAACLPQHAQPCPECRAASGRLRVCYRRRATRGRIVQLECPVCHNNRWVLPER